MMGLLPRAPAAAIAAVALTACAAFDRADVRVAAPSAVRLESDRGATVLAAGAEPRSAPLDRWPRWGEGDVARRTGAGAIELEWHSAGRAMRRTLVPENGHIDAPARALPEAREAELRVGPVHRNPSLVLATPWSNVESVTVRHGPTPWAGWMMTLVGAAVAAGGGLLALEAQTGWDGAPRAEMTAAGASLAGIGLLTAAFGVHFLTTPTRSWAWTPP